MTTEEEKRIVETHREGRRRQKDLERSTRFTLWLVALAVFVAVWLIAGGALHDWILFPSMLLQVYCGAISLCTWRIGRKFCKARRAFCDSMEGMFAAFKEGNASAFQHHDDQSDAAIAEMTRLSQRSIFLPRWR